MRDGREDRRNEKFEFAEFIASKAERGVGILMTHVKGRSSTGRQMSS